MEDVLKPAVTQEAATTVRVAQGTLWLQTAMDVTVSELQSYWSPCRCLSKQSHNADINECSSTNGGCNHVCTNTIGTFLCSCNSGYELESDQRTCVGEWIKGRKILLWIEAPKFVYFASLYIQEKKRFCAIKVYGLEIEACLGAINSCSCHNHANCLFVLLRRYQWMWLQ